MKQVPKILSLIGLLCIYFTLFTSNVHAQQNATTDTAQASLFDMGKMWTFDYPPAEYFKKTYGFEADQKWFEEVRLSALRFANYCSASFVSSDGLVMTNHHCARESGTDCQRSGEDFLKNGFYAKTLKDERKVEGLYVDQLVKIEDITDRVHQALGQDSATKKKMAVRAKIYQVLRDEYKQKGDWKGLELEPVEFYNGGKYALYGFKRYTDIRLVFMPELMLGFFGGDYDNFTYPRYDLDCSFFRVYDEKGVPLKTTHYFKFNPDGAKENEPIFVIGNPGRTTRLSTISDLELRRDLLLPSYVRLLKARSLVLQEFNKTQKSDSLINVIFSLENSYKALNGELDALKNPQLFARKASFEKKFRTDVAAHAPSQAILWDDLIKANASIRQIYPEALLFSPSNRLGSEFLNFAGVVESYLYKKRQNDPMADSSRNVLKINRPGKRMLIEEGNLAAYLKEVSILLGENDPYVKKALNGKSPAQAAKYLLANTRLTDPAVRAELIKNDTSFIKNFEDPILDLVALSIERYYKVDAKLKALQNTVFGLHNSMGSLLFELYGTNIPPDATFSLRINDGVMAGYDYNGTKAPAKTTFYGLYDRFNSYGKQYPWDLPLRWQNPSAKLLPISMDFVTTNDIIGGNSGSPMINKNREVVGLVFDGNMESLSGDFIFVPDQNRAVGVMSSGMLGALHYIYKASRLEKELLGK